MCATRFVQDSQEEMVDDKERFMHRVETRRELHRSITREEKRKRSSRCSRVLASLQSVV
jgi:hypothetical protein